MEISIENFLLFSSLLLIISIITSKSSFKTGVPTLLIFLLVGILAGEEGIGNIKFSNFRATQFIGNIALIFILFSGGLDTNKKNIVPIAKHGIILSIAGVLITAGVLGAFIYYISEFSIYESLLLASIVSSTDAASVFSIFRSRGLGIPKHTQAILELESGSNDPTAYLLTITFLNLIIEPNLQIADTLLFFVKSLVLGGILGVAFGRLMIYTINKINLEIDGLYPVLTIGLSILAFSVTDYIGGNGYLAVYLSALILGSNDFVHKRSIIRIFDGITWLMQIVMFLILGLLVIPSHLLTVAGIAIPIILFMIFIARPIAVFSCLTPLKVKAREQLLISWVGLRGAVPIIFAIYPLVASIPNASTFFNIVFFISVTSLLVQGMAIPSVAKALKLAVPEQKKHNIDLDKYEKTLNQMAEITITEGSECIGKSIVELNLPKELLIVMVNRNGKNITPNGATIIHTLDRLLVVSDHTEIMDNLENIFGLKNVVDDVKPKKYSIKRTLNKQRRKINIIYFNQRHKHRK
ncbi:MAG: potassium/proton antiporter [Bacteroidetes bacterium]|nr:potassium/proton antiporter [Bacteroidota bacterium]